MLDGMGENAERLFQEHRERLIGRPVTFTRLAANSLLVYIDGEPGSGTGLTFWFEPTWHLLGPAGVLLGSRQAQTEDAENHSRLSDLPLKLFKRKLKRCRFRRSHMTFMCFSKAHTPSRRLCPIRPMLNRGISVTIRRSSGLWAAPRVCALQKLSSPAHPHTNLAVG